MKIYLSKAIAAGKSYRMRVLLPFAGIIAALTSGALAIGLAIASSGGVGAAPVQWLIAVLLILLAAGSTLLALRIGNAARRDALLFILGSDAALYALDARELAPSREGDWGNRLLAAVRTFRVIAETDRMLKTIRENGLLEEDLRAGTVKPYAARITGIMQLDPQKKTAVCRVAIRNGGSRAETYDISNHTEELLDLLKRRAISPV